MPVDFQNEPLKSPIKLVKSKNSIGPFQRRMVESKSDEYTNEINEHSEFSHSVRPLRALGNFLRSECGRRAAARRPFLSVFPAIPH
jgi:hypothetical protein